MKAGMCKVRHGTGKTEDPNLPKSLASEVLDLYPTLQSSRFAFLLFTLDDWWLGFGVSLWRNAGDISRT